MKKKVAWICAWTYAGLLLPGGVFAQSAAETDAATATVDQAADQPSEAAAPNGSAPDAAAPVDAAAPPAEATAPADAATVQTDDGGIQEVIVTAQRRKQSLQDVPISVTAVDKDLINATGMTQIQDVSIVTPALVPGSQVGYGQPYIRGIGSDIVTIGTESSVALYVDGVYQSRNLALMSNLSNIERVEVLAGPQGALYGRNATGGVISIVTKKPTPGLQGSFEAGLGDYGLFQSKGYVAGGSDTIAGTFAYYTRQRNGYYENLFNGERVDAQQDYGLAGKLMWTIDPLNEITLAFDRGVTGPDAGAYQNQLGTNNVTVSVVPGAQYTDEPHKTYSDRGKDTMYDNSSTDSVNARWRRTFDGFDLNTIASWRYIRARSSTDVDASSVDFIYFAEPKERTDDYSFEANLTSNGSGPLSWLGGVNYFRTDGFSDNYINVATLASQRVITVTNLDTNAVAGYGQVDYKFGADEKWKISGGLRYTHEKKDIEGEQDVYLGDGYPLAAAIPQPGASKTWDNLSESAVLGYSFTEEVNGYLRFATGFKSGAFNAVQPNDPVLNPEKIKSYEVGFKSSWLDRAIRFNADAFYYDYNNLQVGQITNTGGILYVNAAAAKVYGAEADATWRATKRLTLTLNGALLHSEYDNFAAGAALTLLPGTVNGAPGNYPASTLGVPEPSPNGNELTHAPKFSGTATASYWQPSSIGDFEFTAAARYTGSYYFDIGNALQQKSYTLVNVSLTYHSPDDKYFVRAWANNLTDTDYLNFESRTNAGDFGNYAPPRTYGASAGLKF